MSSQSILSQENIKKNYGWFIVIVICLLPLVKISFDNYITLTIAGLALGMFVFLTASGLSVIFGLMDVLNMAHGAIFAFGGYASYTVLKRLGTFGWVETGTLGQSWASFGLGILAAIIVGVVVGFIIERVIIRQVYGDHLKQILITFGASYVMVEIIKIIWGPNIEPISIPDAFGGSWVLGNIIISKFRVMAIFIGVLVLIASQLVLKKTKIGIIVRAGVENKEVVQAIGYNINKIFTAVFLVGAALAAIGGAMFSYNKLSVYPMMGEEQFIFAIIVVCIGGMGSIAGSFIGAIMVGLAYNYVAFLLPPLALGIDILLMAIILLIKPKGMMGQ